VNLLAVTPKVDEADSLVGFVPGWLNALACRLERVDVLCLAGGPARLAANVRVHSLGKERGASKPAQALVFYRAALRARADVVFCQFSPIFVIAIAPVAKARGWPIVFWYTHRHVDTKLRVASALADRIVTASPESYRLGGPKLRVIGHGIDSARFAPAEGPGPAGRKTVLAVGRIAPIKHYEMLIEAAGRLAARRHDVDFIVAGGPQAPGMDGYFQRLRDLAAERGLGERFRFLGAVPHGDVPALYRQATVAANLCPTGGLDKAVLEGMACGLPTVLRNGSFAPLLAGDAGLLLSPDSDTDSVTHLLDTLLDMPPAERQALGARLRARVGAQHGLEGLADRLVGVMSEVARRSD
jgi:glycosyltransferase involved in cell wall biosynthesis